MSAFENWILDIFTYVFDKRRVKDLRNITSTTIRDILRIVDDRFFEADFLTKKVAEKI